MGKVGVILVNYNGLEDTIACINSIYKSNYIDYEIIVVDNNSTDCPDSLNSYSNVTLIKLDKNVGFGVANNIGAKVAIENGADYIFCLNNDTEISSGLISLFVREIEEKEVLTCSTYYYSNKSELWYGGGEISKIRGTCRQKKYKSDRYVSFICGCCMFFSVETFKDIGLFEPEYKNPLAYMRDLNAVVENGYDVIHIHKNSAAVILPFIVVHKHKDIRVFVHSHNTRPSVNGITKALHVLNKGILWNSSNEHFACSEVAGKWLYGSGKTFTVLKNGIVTQKYRFNPDARDNKRKELNIPNTGFVVGNIGRFTEQKNQKKAG